MTDGETPLADTYAVALQGLAGVLVDRSSLERTLEALLGVAITATPDVDALTVTVRDDDGELTAAATTSETAREVDQREYALTEGPCIAALATGDEQLIRDTASEDRWPRFVAMARDAGITSVAGLPLRAADGEILGALDVFTAGGSQLDDDTLAVLRRVSVPAAAVLANARAYRRAAALGEQLTDTLEQQALWNRAIGIVLARFGGDAGAAAERLRRAADHQGRPVQDLAAELAAGGDPDLEG